jgi:hypothetical protein
MNSVSYLGYLITEDNGRWCVNLGIELGIKCFGSLEEAKRAVDERVRKIEGETGGRH